jgi:hypothetical protein
VIVSDPFSHGGKSGLSVPKHRHPELPSMRTRSHQRPNRGEGPCVFGTASSISRFECFSSPQLRPTTRQVSGHEFTRAVQPQKDAGFSPCSKPQGLKAKLLEPHTARLKSCPDTCLAGRWTPIFTPSCYLPLALLRLSAPPRLRGKFPVLRASVPPWWVSFFRSPDHPITGSPDLAWVPS